MGSNGGGFFGANDAHPFENPDIITFIIHSVIVFLLPMAFIFMVGFYLKNRRFGFMLFAVMFIGFVLITIPITQQEVKGNTFIAHMGINTTAGNTEGKETRFGSLLSAFYCGINVSIPAGTVAAAHDSFMPLSGIFMLIAMQIDAFFGGVGTGWLNMLIFVIIAIFIGTLMIGRTPELLGKKISVKEMQLATIVLLLAPLFYLGFTAVAANIFVHYKGGNNTLQWLSNNSAHGFTTMLYEFTSSYAGNGSGFEGLGDNTAFWNITTAIVMLAGRFIPIAGTLIIAGLLSKKQCASPSAGTLRADSISFGAFLFCVIIIVQVLSFLPALMLGPVNEYFQMQK